MARSRKKLGEILVEAGVLDERRLRAALTEQKRWGGHLGRILIEMKLISEDVLVQALSRQLNFPTVSLDNKRVSNEVLDLVPGEVAEQNSLVPFNVEGKFLDVAMTDPTNLGIVDELRIRTQLNVRPYLAGPKMIERALARFYERGPATMTLGVTQRPDRAAAAAAVEFDGVNLVDLDSGRGPEMSAAQRRASSAALYEPAPSSPDSQVPAQIANLQDRIAKLEALLTRDEDVIRKLMGLLVEKGIATREEILERIK